MFRRPDISGIAPSNPMRAMSHAEGSRGTEKFQAFSHDYSSFFEIYYKN